jgi:hypothetical protein
MSKPKTYELVMWEDPKSDIDGKWVDLAKLQAVEPEIVYSIGWTAYEDEHHIRLCMDWSEGHGYTFGEIPKSAIKARKRVNLRGFPPKVGTGKYGNTDLVPMLNILAAGDDP